jgi:phage tail protein X
VLCTLGLEWLLRDKGAAEAFSDLLGLDEVLAWQAETVIDSGRRIDLTGWTAGDNGVPIVTLEAKIHHALTRAQVDAYILWQQNMLATATQHARGLMCLLVPKSRRDEAAGLLVDASSTTHTRVETWDSLFKAMADAGLNTGAIADLAQLESLYHQYDDTWIAPFSLEEITPPGWRTRSEDYELLADLLSRELQRSVHPALGRPRLLPMQKPGFRYVTMRPGSGAPNLAVGTFDDLADVPFAVRYHKLTHDFREITERLDASVLEVDHAGGHSYVRLRVPVAVTHAEILADLQSQLRAIVAIAHPDLSLTPHSAPK